MTLKFVTIAWLLSATAIAAPAHEVPEALAARQTACPVVSQWYSHSYKTEYASTTTVTNGISYLGSITSTKTELETRTQTLWQTVISPAVTTYPATTVTSYIAAPTETLTYLIIEESVTVSGYAPSSQCLVTTITNIIPGTTTITYTYDLFYATTWTTEVGHVLTSTVIKSASTTSTQTRPGSTAYATTATRVWTTTPIQFLVPTVTVTAYAKGCKSWACQS